MWQHEIIDECESFNIGGLGNTFTGEIEDSQVFYMGDSQIYHDAFGKMKSFNSDEIFESLPYDFCTFEYKQGSDRFVVVVSREDRELSIFVDSQLVQACLQHISMASKEEVKGSELLWFLSKPYRNKNIRWAPPNVLEKLYDLANVYDKRISQNYQDVLSRCMGNIVLFLAFINRLPNVRTRKVEPCTVTQNEKRVRKGKRPLYSYHVVEIAPFRDRPEKWIQAGDSEELNRRAHLCRGHYRVYLPERPLFGKYSGVFWINAHGRGDVSNGLIDKEYKVVT